MCNTTKKTPTLIGGLVLCVPVKPKRKRRYAPPKRKFCPHKQNERACICGMLFNAENPKREDGRCQMCHEPLTSERPKETDVIQQFVRENIYL